MVPESTSYLMKWLDRLWGNILTDKKGRPLIKVHGFGLTTASLMTRYPWYSVDSTSWLMAAASGSIYYHSPDWRIVLKAIAYSDQSPARKVRRAHFRTLSKKEQKIIRQQIKEKGFKKRHLQGRQYGRSWYNIHFFYHLEQEYSWPKKFKNPNQGLFDEKYSHLFETAKRKKQRK
jgi:uncharacterized protein Usg